MDNINAIARLCHEANRAYCLALGDTSQLPWEEAPDWQQLSAIRGVEFIIANPDALPSASHESWLEEKRATGWKYGPVKDPEAKTHPCFVPYDELPADQRAKDHIFGAIVRAVVNIGDRRPYPADQAIENALTIMSEEARAAYLLAWLLGEWDKAANILNDPASARVTLAPEPELVTPRSTPLTPDDVDALSFAARTAQDAAAGLYGLFVTDEGVPVDDWLGLRQGTLEGALEQLVRFIVDYGTDNPETVWLQAVSEGLAIREAAHFRDLPFARRQAFATFTRVAAATHAAIAQVQAATEQAHAALLAAAATPPLKREDSILEEHGRLDELIPGGKEFLAQQDAQRARFNGANPAAFDHDGDGKPGGSKAPPADESPDGSGPPMSIGEKPSGAATPNKGGRPPKGGKRR